MLIRNEIIWIWAYNCNYIMFMWQLVISEGRSNDPCTAEVKFSERTELRTESMCFPVLATSRVYSKPELWYFG